MIDIRLADKKDIPVIAKIVNETWKVAYKDIVPESDLINYTDKTRRENQIADFFVKGEPVFYVARKNSIDCGIISYKKYEDY